MALVGKHSLPVPPPPPTTMTMADALAWDDPEAALRALSLASQQRAIQRAHDLAADLPRYQPSVLPDVRTVSPPFHHHHQDNNNNNNNNNTTGGGGSGHHHHRHLIDTATACADSILHSLTKIASGGSQASDEIRRLEQEKTDFEAHAAAVQTALMLRAASERATQALLKATTTATTMTMTATTVQDYATAAEAVRCWLDWKQQDSSSSSSDPRCRAYVGEYSLQQLATAYTQLKTTMLQQYEGAVKQGDLQSLGQLTPVLGLLHLEEEAVRLYLQFLKTILQTSMQQALIQPPLPPKGGQAPPPPYLFMARVYNAAVSCLRHHLPMVSHCLYQAHGDAAVVQLVHAKVEEHVLPLLRAYQRDRQLATVSRQAQRIYSALEERYTGRNLVDDNDMDDDNDGGGGDGVDRDDDGGFAVHIGTLSDVDTAMEEAALLIQHSVSYLRFMEHTAQQVHGARRLRHHQAQQVARLERERHEWTTTTTTTTGSSSNNSSSTAAAPARTAHDHRHQLDEDQEVYQELMILPPSTQLHQSVAEIGGQYAAIERCLLLAGMQRAFVVQLDRRNTKDARCYRPLSMASGSSPTQALQTTLVETCLYAARRGTQRAFATGHVGTASAMTNFGVDCLTVLLEVLSNRAEEFGVARLKPGEGLLVGSAGIFNATNALIRQGTQHVGSAVAGQQKDELLRRKQTQESIARACAVMNDLEVAVHHTELLESLLRDSIDRGFPPDTHETEQLRMCVKSLGTVTESFKVASDATIESLESVLKPRIRSWGEAKLPTRSRCE
jgi:conserved oligomeric Golgi complex subunit 4